MQPFRLQQHPETVVRADGELLQLLSLLVPDDTYQGMSRDRLVLERKSRVAHGAVNRRTSSAHLFLVQQSIQVKLHSADKKLITNRNFK